MAWYQLLRPHTAKWRSKGLKFGCPPQIYVVCVCTHLDSIWRDPCEVWYLLSVDTIWIGIGVVGHFQLVLLRLSICSSSPFGFLLAAGFCGRCFGLTDWRETTATSCCLVLDRWWQGGDHTTAGLQTCSCRNIAISFKLNLLLYNITY